MLQFSTTSASASEDTILANSSGSATCAGGPGNYAGVHYKIPGASSYGGLITFMNPSTGDYDQYDVFEDGLPEEGTVYSSWNTADWVVQSHTVEIAYSVCMNG